MRQKLLFEILRCKAGLGLWSVSLIVLYFALVAMPSTAFAQDTNSIKGRIVTDIVGEKVFAGPADAQDAIMQDTEITLFALPAGKIVGKAAPDWSGEFAFFGLEPGEYLVQVVAPNYIVSKTKVTVGSAREPQAAEQQLEIRLRRPIDPGMGPGPSFSHLLDVREQAAAGVNHAFGCISISLVFVQFQGSNTWTATQISNAMNAATTAMNAFQSIAPPGANITTHVENLGTFTVTNPVGNWCSEAELWVAEILTQAGYTTGSLSSRIAALSNDRRDANCGTNPICSECGAGSSSYLFFITRDDSTMWGGWNCGNEYLISYWNRYDESVVYMHEVGHGFGALDEYCVPSQDYCCGWVTGSWGCANTGGCLSHSNDNCDPACGSDCGGGGPFVDCQDGCPAWNCTNHTPCAMDGSSTLSFCPDTQIHIGWVDTDGDLVLDCLETACSTDPNNPASYPECVNLPPIADAGGPYVTECSGVNTSVLLDGTGSTDPDSPPVPLAYSWSTDCPGGSFSDSTAAQPTLTVATSPGCLTCNVSLIVTDDLFSSVSDSTTITIQDTTPPVFTCPADITIECDQSTDPSNTGYATATDTCDATLSITYADSETPGDCPAEKTITRTWTATDDCGNSSPCVQTINVVDTTPPVITCPSDITIECDQSTDPSNTGYATATDTCDATPAITYADSETPGDCPAEKTITRTWTATDDCGNSSTCVQTINVVDTTPPVISCNAPSTIIPPDAPISFTATATDNCDGSPSVEIVAFDCYKFTKKGKQIDKTESCVVNLAGDSITILDSGGVGDIITWTVLATDSCGNESVVDCSIKVVNPAHLFITP